MDDFYKRAKLQAINVDIETLIATNRNGRNDRDIRILVAIRKDLEAILGLSITEPPVLMELVANGKTIRVIVEHREANPTFQRWQTRHPRGGAVMASIKWGGGGGGV